MSDLLGFTRKSTGKTNFGLWEPPGRSGTPRIGSNPLGSCPRMVSSRFRWFPAEFGAPKSKLSQTGFSNGDTIVGLSTGFKDSIFGVFIDPESPIRTVEPEICGKMR